MNIQNTLILWDPIHHFDHQNGSVAIHCNLEVFDSLFLLLRFSLEIFIILLHNEIGRSSKLKYKRDTDIRMTCLSKHKKSTKRSNSQRNRTSFKQASYTKKLIRKNQTKGLVLKNAGIPELSKTIFLPK